MKFLGKIEKVRLGTGGYQDVMFGFTFHLVFDRSATVVDFWGYWNSDPSEGAKWSVNDRVHNQGLNYEKFRNLMNDAKANDIRELEGKPIEVEMDGMKMVSWRILKEVL